ncbi:LysE family translocator [Aliiglaciecola sp. CAU 1673]|uniref:LysE family translocator n=1 Tax=Aliiglaciecola sp. CAU 1673 TaxID=3032595 RepID=UPI0023DA9E4E|nr:LysE family translocator [Aliiglaciecola sp. CAU 1673]MDF2176985.1 LysE family translocator [Aliiglaciecola sp. CAU 1673]
MESLLSLMLFTALILGSPGPAPIALAMVGLSFGVRAGVPFLAGILCGLLVAMLTAYWGLVQLFALWPGAQIIAQLIGALYLGYVALKIARMPAPDPDNQGQSAPGFKVGFIFNLLNPKAYAAFLAIFSSFALENTEAYSVAWLPLAAVMLSATLVDSLWLGLGGLLGPRLSNPTYHKRLRQGFALSLLMLLTLGLFRALQTHQGL